MSRHTYHFGCIYFVIEIEQLDHADWIAWSAFRGERLEARAATEQGATAALLVVLRSEIAGNSTPK